jgi:predicted PurR-regulated permease PerM
MALEQPAQPVQWTFGRTVWATLILAFTAFGFWLLYRFNQVVFILFIAIVMGTVIRPAVTWLHMRGLPRIAGIMVVYILLFILVIGFALLLFPMIVEQGTTLAGAMPGYYSNLREWVMQIPNQLIKRMSEFLPAALPGLPSNPQTGQEVMASAGQALGYLSLAGQVFFISIVILVLAFYWTLDGPRTVKTFLMLVPQEKREGISELVTAMETKVGSFIAGQGILCLTIAVMALTAYLLIGLPNALILALVAGVMEAVPMVGPLLGAVPAALVALAIGPDRLLWVIVSTVIIQQLENSFLVPRIMSKAVGVNPFVSMLAFFAFSSLLGIPGALMAIPMAAILQILLDRFVFYPGVLDAEIPAGRDLASRLRYEAQNLVQNLRKQARIKKGGSAQHIKDVDQVMDEIEAITTDLDSLLAQAGTPGTP